jgi:CDP-diacylglycerol--glycerol-3-phosphate 3-phosphatidyltransferase
MQTGKAKPLVFSRILNVPNQLTGARLILAIVMFCLIPWGEQWSYMTSLVLFVLAAGTDWLDGWYARKYGAITVLGRILDPFADKVIICGTFIFLVAVPEMTVVAGGLQAWMVVVIVARELLVTALRGLIEQAGGDFSAKTSGKLKMVLQCIAAAVSLFYLSFTEGAPGWVLWAMILSIWATVVITVWSGLVYVVAAVKMMRGQPSSGDGE